MKNKLSVLFGLLLIASMVLSACGGAAPTEEPAATEAPATEAPATEAPATEAPTEEPAAEPVTIAFWEQEGEDVDVFIDGLIADFQAANPNITVERTHYENEALRDQFQTASLAEAAPEVVRVPNDFAGPFSQLEIIAPIDQVFDQAFLDQFFTGALENAVVGGTLWGVPDNYGNHLMLIYNKSLIAEPPATFEELVTTAKELTTGDIQGFAYNINEPYWGAGFYGAFGGWPLDENDQPQFNNEAFVNYLNFVAQLKADGVVPQECDYNCADTLMKEGKAAMIINGDWSLGDYSTALGENFAVAPVPTINGNPYTEMTGGKYFMVSKAVLDDGRIALDRGVAARGLVDRERDRVVDPEIVAVDRRDQRAAERRRPEPRDQRGAVGGAFEQVQPVEVRGLAELRAGLVGRGDADVDEDGHGGLPRAAMARRPRPPSLSCPQPQRRSGGVTLGLGLRGAVAMVVGIAAFGL